MLKTGANCKLKCGTVDVWFSNQCKVEHILISFPCFETHAIVFLVFESSSNAGEPIGLLYW